MNEKEKFEDIIESKFSEAEFPFDEANWDGAEEMISSYRKKEKRKRFGFIFLAGIILGVVIMFPFVNNLSDASNNVIAEVEKSSDQKPDESNIIDQSSLIEKNKFKNTNDELNGEEGKIISSSLQEHVAKQKNKENELIDNNESTNLSSTTTKSEISQKNNFAKRKRKNKSVISQPIIGNQGNVIKHKKQNDEGTESIFLINKIDKLEANNKEADNKSASLSPVKDELLLLEKLKTNEIKTNDSTPFVQNLINVEPSANSEKLNLMHPWSFSASMGGNYVNHFSLNPIQGIEITKTITPHVEIGTGAYYTYLTVESGGVKSITTHTDYDFGYRSDITEIKTNKLHYIVVPVFAKYNLNDKNSFILGTNIFALFTSSNSITTYKESYGEKQGVVSKKTSGYSNGINRYDVGLLAGYKYQLFGNFGAAIYFNYGLRDIKKNDYYDENKFERNISGQFMLTYKLK